jgi:hypothetical protein
MRDEDESRTIGYIGVQDLFGDAYVQKLKSAGFPLLLALLALSTATPPIRGVQPSLKKLVFGKSSPSSIERAWKRLSGKPMPEAVEMLAAIAGGSEMGPGEGWFHGSQSRYNWKWLSSRYDTNHDGKITRAEFKGPSALFDRLDRNKDGVLDSSDFDWSDRSTYAMQGMPAGFWFRKLDANSNGRVSKEEWNAFFAKISGGKDYLTPEDLRQAFPVAPPSRPKPSGPPQKEGPSEWTLITGLLRGELGSIFAGPKIDQEAPDFSLKTADGVQTVRLWDNRGKKPIVLIFGSFT